MRRLVPIVALLALAQAGCYRSYARRAVDDAATDPELPDFAIDPGTDEFVECHDRVYDVSLGRPDVLILLDRSNSMCPVGGPRYLQHAVDAVRDIVSTWKQQITFGYTVFPSRLCVPESSFLCTPTTSMAVDVERGNETQILAALADTECCGGTPVAESLEFAGRTYAGLDDGHAHHVLLVTDGAPNCNAGLNRFSCVCTDTGDVDCDRFEDSLNCLDDARTIAAAAELEAAGVPVHVLGLADAAVTWSRVMDDIAEAGGTDRAVLAEEPDAIAEAMDSIAGDVAPCRFHFVPGEVVDPARVHFLIDGDVVPWDPTHTDGWDWLNAWTVDFFGSACERIVEGTAVQVTARVNCDEP